MDTVMSINPKAHIGQETSQNKYGINGYHFRAMLESAFLLSIITEKLFPKKVSWNLVSENCLSMKFYYRNEVINVFSI